MPKYSLTQKNKSYLTLEIEGKTYNIPLANAMKVKEVRKLMKITKLDDNEQLDLMFDFLSEHMGAEVVDEMLTEDVKEIFELWGKANAQAEGLTLGESMASQSS